MSLFDEFDRLTPDPERDSRLPPERKPVGPVRPAPIPPSIGPSDTPFRRAPESIRFSLSRGAVVAIISGAVIAAGLLYTGGFLTAYLVYQGDESQVAGASKSGGPDKVEAGPLKVVMSSKTSGGKAEVAPDTGEQAKKPAAAPATSVAPPPAPEESAAKPSGIRPPPPDAMKAPAVPEAAKPVAAPPKPPATPTKPVETASVIPPPPAPSKQKPTAPKAEGPAPLPAAPGGLAAKAPPAPPTLAAPAPAAKPIVAPPPPAVAVAPPPASSPAPSAPAPAPVTAPVPSPAASKVMAKSAQPVPPGAVAYSVQLGAFSSEENAQRLLQKLSKSIDALRVDQGNTPSGRTLYYLRAGLFAKKAEANAFIANLKSEQIIKAGYVIRVRAPG